MVFDVVSVSLATVDVIVPAKDRKLSLIEINLIGFEEWKDLISDKIINDIDAEIVLKPYQTLWISNQF